MVVQEPLLMSIPVEIRLMIYSYLFDTGESSCFTIRNREEHSSTQAPARRTHYHTQTRTLARRSYKTTYCLYGDYHLHPAILGVSQRIREEASPFLYGKTPFHFRNDVEAAVAFLSDRTASSLGLLKEIIVHKQMAASCTWDADSSAWSYLCTQLSSINKLNKLRLVIEGGRPRHAWDGPQELSLSDFRFLYSTRHDCLDWARALAGVGTIGEVEITADMRGMTKPTTTRLRVCAAFSASIETTLVEFLNTDLNVPARVASK